MLYLVTYDICDAKRLRQISSLLRRYGLRVQKSVFECRISAILCRQLQAELKVLCRGKDSVLIYGISVGNKEELHKNLKKNQNSTGK